MERLEISKHDGRVGNFQVWLGEDYKLMGYDKYNNAQVKAELGVSL